MSKELEQLLENAKELKVIATAKGFDGHQRVDAGVVFNLKEKTGLDRDGSEKVFSVKEQFSKRWMKPFTGKKVNVTVDGDFDPEEEEVVIVPRKKNKKGDSKPAQEVI